MAERQTDQERAERAPQRPLTDAELVQQAARKAEEALAEQDPAKAREGLLKQQQDDAKRAAQRMRDEAGLSLQERAANAQADEIEAALNPLGETVPGGKYLIGADVTGKGGVLVNAEGKEIDESGKVKES